MPNDICYNMPRQNEMSDLQKSTKTPSTANTEGFLFRLGRVAYALGWLPIIPLRPTICRYSRLLHLP